MQEYSTFINFFRSTYLFLYLTRCFNIQILYCTSPTSSRVPWNVSSAWNVSDNLFYASIVTNSIVTNYYSFQLTQYIYTFTHNLLHYDKSMVSMYLVLWLGRVRLGKLFSKGKTNFQHRGNTWGCNSFCIDKSDGSYVEKDVVRPSCLNILSLPTY